MHRQGHKPANIDVNQTNLTKAELPSGRRAFLPHFQIDQNGRIQEEPGVVLVKLLEHNNGLYLGDYHYDLAVRQFLIGQIPSLSARAGTFFTELVHEKDQQVLEELRLTGDRSLLQSYLASRNIRYETDLRQGDIDLHFRAYQAGMLIYGIDVPDEDFPKFNLERRLFSSNPFWTSVVHKRLPTDGSKYIVWGGNAHSGKHRGVTGVDTHLGIPAVDFEPQLLPKGKVRDNSFHLKAVPHREPGVYLGNGLTNDIYIVLPTAVAPISY